ncbi:AdoMet_MTases domain containing protein [Candidatus Nanopelagicaceae bacterium]
MVKTMRLLSKFQNLSPNDESTITALKDEYINFIYENIYKEMYLIAKNHLMREPNRTLEIGAGSLSKAEQYFSNIQLSDGSSVSKFGKENQLIAENLPFEKATFDIVLAKDTLHHFSDTDKALSEISRVLKPDGLFIVSEPYWSLLGRVIFRFIHPEKWETNPSELKNESSDPFDANQATLLCLHGSKFNDLVIKNSLILKVSNPTYGFSYLLSGGLNWRNKIPFSFLRKIDRAEKYFKTFKYFTGLNILATFKKS